MIFLVSKGYLFSPAVSCSISADRVGNKERDIYVVMFFCVVISDADGPVPLELPNQWLWDIIDEFIYQVTVAHNNFNSLILQKDY